MPRFIGPVKPYICQLLLASLIIVSLVAPVFAQSPRSTSPRSTALTPGEAAEGMAGCAACGGCWLFIFLFIIGAIALNIALLVWVARDSKNRSMDSSVLWMLMVMFVGPIGLLIYVLSRPQGNLVQCSHCGNKRLQASKTCPHCSNT